MNSPYIRARVAAVQFNHWRRDIGRLGPSVDFDGVGFGTVLGLFLLWRGGTWALDTFIFTSKGGEVRRMTRASFDTELLSAARKYSGRKKVVGSWAARLRAQMMPGPYGVRFNGEGRSRAWGNAVVGLRNPAHSMVKLMNPMAGNALRVSSYTHPEYAVSMAATLELTHARALLLRGTEGEVVADPRRTPQMDAFAHGQRTRLVEAQAGSLQQLPDLPAQIDALSTALTY